MLHQPTAGVSREQTIEDPGLGSEGGQNVSTQTARSQLENEYEPLSNIQPYVTEFNRIIASYKAGE